MSRIAFPSLSDNQKHYTIHSGTLDYDVYSNCRSLHIANWAGWFSTYGDGACQHAPECIATESVLLDYCASLASCILDGSADGKTAHKMLGDHLIPRVTREAVAFALTVKYAERKRLWYSKSERKVSSSESKRHDKRWDEVTSDMDGSPEAVWRMVRPDYPSALLDRLLQAQECRQIIADITDRYCDSPIGMIGWNTELRWCSVSGTMNMLRGLACAWRDTEAAECHLANYQRSLEAPVMA